ncbi:hypothetical protein J5N97_030022 [Dioscorea zingiberensis]|uniref:Uncharacterized protein n=1 Tax=Dioscorea zingiberensis TaxID=325984 RepID=A0A9D5H3V2_9LILI|nr:hypothetical protein J5N97_030022 [Dioscorea zingiberensis]
MTSEGTATCVDILLVIILPPLGVSFKFGCKIIATRPIFQVRDEIEQLMDDDVDMAEMYPTQDDRFMIKTVKKSQVKMRSLH